MIRSATLTDLAPLTQLFDAYRAFYRKPADLAGAEAFMRERIERGDATIYVVDINGELVGFTQLYPIFSSTRMQRLWLLNDLFVAPPHRGQGYSLQLLEQAKVLCRATHAAGILLETEVTNTVGNRLYPRAGFVRNEERYFYQWNNIP